MHLENKVSKDVRVQTILKLIRHYHLLVSDLL